MTILLVIQLSNLFALIWRFDFWYFTNRSGGIVGTCPSTTLYKKIRRCFCLLDCIKVGRFSSFSILVVHPSSLPFICVESLVMYLTPLLWILSSFIISCFVYVSHMIDPYSIFDLTRAIYAVFLHSLGQCYRFLLRNPSVELASLQVLFICSFHLKSSAICSPS